MQGIEPSPTTCKQMPYLLYYHSGPRILSKGTYQNPILKCIGLAKGLLLQILVTFHTNKLRAAPVVMCFQTPSLQKAFPVQLAQTGSEVANNLHLDYFLFFPLLWPFYLFV